MEATLLFDRFQVHEELGAGDAAEVLRVWDTKMEWMSALKVLRVSNPEMMARLRREATVQAQIVHPNVVAAREIFSSGSELAILMDLVEGVSLAAYLEENGALSVDDALALFRPVVEGIRAAHEVGVVHRDLNPDNILVTRSGPRVIDFGLAKPMSEGSALTRDGASIGKPGYAAPEQLVDAASVDRSADIFSLGTILYEMLGGMPAYHVRANALQSLLDAADGRHIPIAELVDDLPTHVADAVEACIQPSPQLRFESCDALIAALYLDPAGKGRGWFR